MMPIRPVFLSQIGAYNDQPTDEELLRLQMQQSQQRNAAKTPIYERPNLDRNAYDSNEHMGYSLSNILGLLQERL